MWGLGSAGSTMLCTMGCLVNVAELTQLLRAVGVVALGAQRAGRVLSTHWTPSSGTGWFCSAGSVALLFRTEIYKFKGGFEFLIF